MNTKDFLQNTGSRPFIFGEGRISGYLSALLGLCALAAVLAFKFPDLLTTAELRGNLYTESFARNLLLIGLITSFTMGTISYLLNSSKKLAITGISTSFIALILGGVNVELGTISQGGASFGLDWLILDLIISMMIFIPLEKAFAQKKIQILRPEWRTDMVYFVVAHLAIQFFLLFTNTVAYDIFGWAATADLHAFTQSFPWWAQLLAALIIADLFQYAGHRIYHEVPFMWKFHAVHHSSKTMDWLAGSRTHFVEVLLTRTMVIVPLYVIGFSEEVLNMYVIWVGIQSVFIHANVNWNFGPLKYLLVTPQFHHWHHSDDPEYAYKNYAVHLPVIDMIFGTYKMPPEWPETYGVLGKPLPQGFIKQFFYPFKR